LDPLQIGMDCEDQWKLTVCIWKQPLVGEPFSGTPFSLPWKQPPWGAFTKWLSLGMLPPGFNQTMTPNRQAGFCDSSCFQSSHLPAPSHSHTNHAIIAKFNLSSIMILVC
jgi:hypothetical protein